MLGDHQLLERKLRKSGKAALATVVSFHKVHTQQQSGPVGVGAAKSLCKLGLRVAPDGEATFEASTETWLMGTEVPQRLIRRDSAS